jgi:hypothetical protein
MKSRPRLQAPPRNQGKGGCENTDRGKTQELEKEAERRMDKRKQGGIQIDETGMGDG